MNANCFSVLRSNDVEPVEINVQNNKSDVKNNVNHVKKGEMTLQEWLDEFDVLLNDFSNDKRKLCEKIKAASLKVSLLGLISNINCLF